jgi:hypothetical protein
MDISGNTSTYVHGVVLPGNVRDWTDRPIHRRVETMVILRRQAEDGERTALVPLGLALVRVPKETRHRKLATLDPDARRVLHGLECHHAAVGAADEAIRVVRLFNRASVGLELAVEKLVEGLCASMNKHWDV